MGQSKQKDEKNYLDIIFNNEDYESPEEKAIRRIERLPLEDFDNDYFKKKGYKI